MSQEKVLHSKQFIFQSGHSTEHAILQLPNQIHDLSKAFDTVNHSIILKKLEKHGIHGKNLEWFKSYLRNRKQYIQIDKKNKTDFKQVQYWDYFCFYFLLMTRKTPPRFSIQ